MLPGDQPDDQLFRGASAFSLRDSRLDAARI
jgi:hypothetical protein